MLAVVNYGAGNIRSVVNALTWLETEVRVADRPAALADAAGVILPGVGAFIPAMERLDALGFADALRDWVTVRGRPLLGICLGMQLLAERGTEGGEHAGLGLIAARVERLAGSASARVPHVGWNAVARVRPATLWGTLEGAVCYFVHGYQLAFADSEARKRWLVGTADHGGEVIAMVEHELVMAAQFHPEKSQRDGLAMLANFVEFCAAC